METIRSWVGAIAPVAVVPSDNQGLGCILRSPIRFYPNASPERK
ncbi:MAG: hypothetical protein ACRC8Y_00315 [Chroococcales cyanobacterium]